MGFPTTLMIRKTSAMSIYKPTWLYIKQHKQTGLKYFGKTTCNDPFTYKGSGIYWKRHLSKYGNEVDTIWVQLFTDRETLVETALLFSKKNNIVNSKEWANLKEENGLDGMPPGTTAFNKGMKQPHKPRIDSIQRLTRSDKGITRGPRVIIGPIPLSKLKGRIRPRVDCPYCNKNIDEANFHRYHGDKCKLARMF